MSDDLSSILAPFLRLAKSNKLASVISLKPRDIGGSGLIRTEPFGGASFMFVNGAPGEYQMIHEQRHIPPRAKPHIPTQRTNIPQPHDYEYPGEAEEDDEEEEGDETLPSNTPYNNEEGFVDSGIPMPPPPPPPPPPLSDLTAPKVVGIKQRIAVNPVKKSSNVDMNTNITQANDREQLAKKSQNFSNDPESVPDGNRPVFSLDELLKQRTNLKHIDIERKFRPRWEREEIQENITKGREGLRHVNSDDIHDISDPVLWIGVGEFRNPQISLVSVEPLTQEVDYPSNVTYEPGNKKATKLTPKRPMRIVRVAPDLSDMEAASKRARISFDPTLDYDSDE